MFKTIQPDIVDSIDNISKLGTIGFDTFPGDVVDPSADDVFLRLQEPSVVTLTGRGILQSVHVSW